MVYANRVLSSALIFFAQICIWGYMAINVLSDAVLPLLIIMSSAMLAVLSLKFDNRLLKEITRGWSLIVFILFSFAAFPSRDNEAAIEDGVMFMMLAALNLIGGWISAPLRTR